MNRAMLTGSPLELVLEKFPDARKNGTGWVARCPAHDDRKPSLSIDEGDDGRGLLCCQAGCSFDEILAAAGLEARDLFVPRERTRSTKQRRTRPDRNIPTPRDRSRELAVYPYRDEHGVFLYEIARMPDKLFLPWRPDGHGAWIMNLDGVRRVLYRLPELVAAPVDQTVFIVEGEKDVHSLRDKFGCLATTNPGGAGKWRAEYNEALRGRHVVIFPDNDDKGEKHARAVARSLHGVAASVRIVHLP